MRQIALPLAPSNSGPPRIVVGNANSTVVEALSDPARWPFKTAVLNGPPRSGKSLLGRWFVENGGGDLLDDAEGLPEDALFHAWNRAQELGRALLMVSNAPPWKWQVALPDLRSRLGSALHLEIGTPDDVMMGELIALHAEMRGLVLDPGASAYLVPRCRRSHVAAEQLVTAIDRLSLERKQAPKLSIWRAALNETTGLPGDGT